MKRTLLTTFLVSLMCAALAQSGFVATSYENASTGGSASTGQIFVRSSTAGGYTNEGLEQPFLYRGTETIHLADVSDLPYLYRSERVPAAIPSSLGAAGANSVYLLPIHGLDTLMTVILAIPGATCGDGLVVTDYDGNVYNTVLLGTHCWTRENLYSLHYMQDGSEIPDPKVYVSDMYPDEAANLLNYGRLYTWYAAVKVSDGDNHAAPVADLNGHVQGICPIGWHLPNALEMQDLRSNPAPSLKTTYDWLTPGTNTTHFRALPAGLFTGTRFENLKGYTAFWSTTADGTQAESTSLSYSCDEPLTEKYNKTVGLSVRCVQD